MGRVIKTKKKLPNGEVWEVEKYVGEYSLEDYEKEITISCNVSDTVATIFCSHKQTNTKLKKLKGIKVVEESKYGTIYKIPKSEISIGTVTGVCKASSKQKTKSSD